MHSSPVPASAAPNVTDDPVVELVDFKWLMAGEGHWVDVARLKIDRCYARSCLALAAGSRCGPLRDAGLRIRGWLEGVAAPR